LTEKIKEKTRDCSDADSFVFAIECDCCRREYRTLPIPFDPLLEIKEEAADCAFQLALSDFSGHMNICPECGRIICEKCFLICEQDDMCADCATRLQLSGESVTGQ
jgi:hypothetical protein